MEKLNPKLTEMYLKLSKTHNELEAQKQRRDLLRTERISMERELENLMTEHIIQNERTIEEIVKEANNEDQIIGVIREAINQLQKKDNEPEEPEEQEEEDTMSGYETDERPVDDFPNEL